MWIGRAIDNHLSFVHDLTIVDQQLFVLDDKELALAAVHFDDLRAMLAVALSTERDSIRNFQQHSCVFRGTCVKHLGNAWQTTAKTSIFFELTLIGVAL